MLTKTARFRFHPDLVSLLPRSCRTAEITYALNGPQSVKHLIEALGIPHTELGTIQANGQIVNLDYLVQAGDTIAVLANERTAEPGAIPQFALDGHLGRLARSLRMLGLDCAYRGDIFDAQLRAIAEAEDRWLLTRDRRLLMYRTVAKGYLVRSHDSSTQLIEILQRFSLHSHVRPFTRCIRCNHALRSVSKQSILNRLQPLTRVYYYDFRACDACGQVYWRGSHVDRMLARISAIPGFDTGSIAADEHA
jgi:uncharacterized protein with PIN domain/sulfur carrier protein ThiS